MSFLSFQDLHRESYFQFEYIIKDYDNYFAHLPKESDDEVEKLLSHSNLVLEYALKLIEENKKEASINCLVSQITNNQKMQNDIKLFYLKAIYWHDIGKINENFQIEKMGNNYFAKVENGISSKHSILSAYLYLVSCFEYINRNYQEYKEKIELISISINFAMTIWRHHSGIKKSIQELINDKDEGLPNCNKLVTYLDKLNITINKQIHKIMMENLVNGDLKNHFTHNENYFFLSKSLFSLLIISDYYATAQFMNYGNREDLVYHDFGLISDDFREKVYRELYTDKFEIINEEKKQRTFNQILKDKKNIDFKDFDELQDKSNDNLNHLRNKLFVEVRTNLQETFEKNKKQSLFYIEAPTGAGKTNLSIMSAVEILQQDSSINKIFYVFPFTTLITQTYDSIKNLLCLDNSEIVQLHSKAKYNQKHESDKDGVYGDEKTNFLDNQFMNYPITMLSHVKFFNVLTGTSKDDNYIFHRLANSIVIIDEIQTYSPDLWSKIVYILDSFAEKLNIKFIVMSATLPKIGKILVKEDIDDKFVKLVDNKIEYFKNPNFADRVVEIVELKENTYPKIYKKVVSESRSYQSLDSNESKKVKTIIEFVTKKGADEFYQEAKKENKLFDEIYILSGTVLEPRRRDIIKVLKSVHDKNILLVTTQVVEAGVDIDMDIGFKEKSLVDGDEQLAGRINRNGSKEGSKLFLFEMEKKNANFVYRGDKRLEAQKKNNLSLLKIEGKNFDDYYDQVIDKIKGNNEIGFVENLNSYIDHIKNLRFSETHIKIIEMESLPVFVPLDDKAIDLWKEYKETIRNQELDFTVRQIQLQNLSANMSEYTFSLAMYPGSGIDYLKPYGKEELGYLYLDEYEDVYSYEEGLNTRVLSGSHIGMIL